VTNYYAYLARCSDDSLYAGYTNNIQNREAKHNEGKGARYTRARLPIQIVYFEEFINRSEAMKRECELKKLSKVQKEDLVSVDKAKTT